MATTNRKPRAKRTQPKKCIQTACGNTCIPKSKTCRITDPNAKKKIRQKGKELVDKLQGKNNSKTRVDHAVEKAVTKPKAKPSSTAGKLAYEKLVKESKKSTKRSKSETYNQGLAILGKYGSKDESRTRVDRDVEKASAKTRRKPQTEEDKNRKVFRREEAQRVIRELQGGATKGKSKSNVVSLPPNTELGRLAKATIEAGKETDRVLGELKRRVSSNSKPKPKVKAQEKESKSKPVDSAPKTVDITQRRIEKAEEKYEQVKEFSRGTADNKPVQPQGDAAEGIDKGKKRRTNLVDMDVATRKKLNYIGVDKETGKTNFAEIGLGRDRTPQLNQIQSYRLQRISDGTLPFATNQKVENILRDLRNPITNFKRQGKLLKQLDSLFNNGDE